MVMDIASIKVIQITDTHILDDGASSFNDFDTSASLQNIIKKIKKDESDADIILLTGDLIHEATITSYQKLAEHLSSLTVPVFCLPGNHDDLNMMTEVMEKNEHAVEKIIEVGDWIIILLNTCVTGEHSGKLSNSELDFLRKTLETYSDDHCLIALHHHPVSINSPWMDGMMLINSEEFLSITDEFEQVRGIIWGHIHQEFESSRKEVKLIGSPSTCIQFKPKSDAFAVDEKPPAYRKLELQVDGKIDTEVVYLTE